MTETEQSQFFGEVKVASSIVDFLSSGLYESPAACLKELINNSYDADATTVDLFVKPDADRIIIQDDGYGFTRADFEDHFSRVSESSKRDVSDTTLSGRKKIGLIGIGFIAANEICEEMEIFSTVAGSTELLHVTVDFRKMRQPRHERRASKGGDVTKGDYRGSIERAPRDTHFTRIFLKEVRGHAREMLVGAAKARGLDPLGSTLYGLKPETIRERLKRLRSWGELDFYSQTMLKVGLNVPVRYVESWCPTDVEPSLRRFAHHASRLNFALNYDGTDLRKPVVLRNGASDHVAHEFKLEGEHIAAEGYLYATHGTVTPTDLNGVLIRIREAAVGEYDPTFMGFPKTIGSLLQRWITCELWADDRLEEAMNIDRRTLRQAHRAYAELQTMFHRQLDDFISEVRAKLYTAGASAKRAEQARSQAETIRRIVEQEASELPREARQRIVRAWQPPSDGHQSPTTASAKQLQRQLVQKFTVAEIYEIVVEVATEVLSPDERRRFLEALTERLREPR